MDVEFEGKINLLSQYSKGLVDGSCPGLFDVHELLFITQVKLIIQHTKDVVFIPSLPSLQYFNGSISHWDGEKDRFPVVVLNLIVLD